MTRTLPLLILSALFVSSCPAPKPPALAPNVDVAGWAIGNTHDGDPITIGRNDLAGKALVITYFATW